MIFTRVVMFSLLTIGLFAYFANFGIPEVKPAPPPVAEELQLGGMTMPDFVSVGDGLFNGKGTCTLCHNALGGRAPLLDDAADAIMARLRDPLYSGKARDLQAYLYESMVEPSAYVVAGFGKAGSRDTQSPMPNVAVGSIGLSTAEINAVIAYLQDLWGLEITVQIPDDTAGAEQDAVVAATTAMRSPLGTVEETFAQFACAACHVMAGTGGQLGPDLSEIGATRDRAYLRRAILEPNAEVAEGFPPNLMPGTYGQQMYASELEMIVNHLAGLE